jgi:hypothetical protein
MSLSFTLGDMRNIHKLNLWQPSKRMFPLRRFPTVNHQLVGFVNQPKNRLEYLPLYSPPASLMDNKDTVSRDPTLGYRTGIEKKNPSHRTSH